MDFGKRLRKLRKEADISQRDLAGRVKIDFTYLSKMENGKVDPPSEAVIKRIARELAPMVHRGDESRLADELTLLAGKVPSDVARTIVQHPQALRYLRSLETDVKRGEDWKDLLDPEQEDKGEQ